MIGVKSILKTATPGIVKVARDEVERLVRHDSAVRRAIDDATYDAVTRMFHAFDSGIKAAEGLVEECLGAVEQYDRLERRLKLLESERETLKADFDALKSECANLRAEVDKLKRLPSLPPVQSGRTEKPPS